MAKMMESPTRDGSSEPQAMHNDRHTSLMAYIEFTTEYMTEEPSPGLVSYANSETASFPLRLSNRTVHTA